MAFKMKGSAFKLNNVATKSALKQANVKEEMARKQIEARNKKPTAQNPYTEERKTPASNVGEKKASTEKKSPLEHKAESKQYLSWETEGGKKGKLWEHDGVRYDQEGLKKHRANYKKEERKEETEGGPAKMKSPLEQSWWDTAKDYGSKAWDVGKEAVKKTIDKDLKMKRDLWDEGKQIASGTGAFMGELFRDQGGGYGRTKMPGYKAKEAYSTEEVRNAIDKGDFSNVDYEDLSYAKRNMTPEEIKNMERKHAADLPKNPRQGEIDAAAEAKAAEKERRQQGMTDAEKKEDDEWWRANW